MPLRVVKVNPKGTSKEGLFRFLQAPFLKQEARIL